MEPPPNFDIDDMNLHDENDLFVPHPGKLFLLYSAYFKAYLFYIDIPAPFALPGHRNPAVIEHWGSSVENLLDLEEEDLAGLQGFDMEDLPIPPPESSDGASVGSGAQHELHKDDGPQELDSEDEPDMDDNDLWAMLREHLGDLAEDEWRDICEHLRIALLPH